MLCGCIHHFHIMDADDSSSLEKICRRHCRELFVVETLSLRSDGRPSRCKLFVAALLSLLALIGCYQTFKPLPEGISQTFPLRSTNSLKFSLKIGTFFSPVYCKAQSSQRCRKLSFASFFPAEANLLHPPKPYIKIPKRAAKLTSTYKRQKVLHNTFLYVPIIHAV